ncbi:hypothetical protein ABZ353_08890 [Streptomyces niveus]|uniref:hypothetical protein n=1 Tax=Streptomyces niveus TaxID=193462 RepID=UPI0034085A21
MSEQDLAARAFAASDGYLFLPQRQVFDSKKGVSNWAERTLTGAWEPPELTLAWPPSPGRPYPSRPRSPTVMKLRFKLSISTAS